MMALKQAYDAEWVAVGEYINPWGRLGDRKNYKRNFPISPRENFLRVMTGDKPCYLPSAADMLPFAPRAIPDNVVRVFSLEMDALLPGDEARGGPDMFGVEWEYVPATGGSMVRPGSPKVPDISHWEDYITFPELDDIDWAGSAKRNADLLSQDLIKRVWVLTGLNERLISFMDFDKALLAYVDEDQKDGVHRLYDRLCVFYDGLFERYKTYYACDVVMFNDDWGTQRGPQFSPDTAREMLAPSMRRIAESCHKRGMYLELHCCGKNDILAPVIAESGVDIWMPQEINDFDLLYRLVGDRLRLCVPTEATPAMSDEECLACAARYMDRYGKYGNVIFSQFPEQHPRISEFLYYMSREAYAGTDAQSKIYAPQTADFA
jgi:hypothetical protein